MRTEFSIADGISKIHQLSIPTWIEYLSLINFKIKDEIRELIKQDAKFNNILFNFINKRNKNNIKYMDITLESARRHLMSKEKDSKEYNEIKISIDFFTKELIMNF